MRRNWLAEKREQKGLNQTQLAEKCGVSNKTISNIEAGIRSPSGELAIKISEVLELDMKLMKLLFQDEKIKEVI